MGPFRPAAALALIAAGSTLTLDTPFAQDDGTVELPNITVTGTRLVPGPGRGTARRGTPSGTTSAPLEPASSHVVTPERQPTRR